MKTQEEVLLQNQLQALYQAIATSNLSELKTLKQNNISFNLRNPRGQTPLHWAAEKDVTPEVIDFLLEQNMDINVKDRDEKTPLHLATIQGHDAKVSLFIQKGADITCKTNMGVTVFHLAAQYGQLNILERLLKNKIASEKKELLKVLDNEGKTVLHYAAAQAKVEIVKLLLEAGALADYDNDLNSPLHLAARYGFKSNAELLFEAGVELTAKNHFGETPYRISLRFGHIPLALWLKSQMPQAKLNYEMLHTDTQTIQAIAEADSYLTRNQLEEAKKNYQSLLNQARQKKNTLLEMTCLQKLSEPFLFDKSFAHWKILYPVVAPFIQQIETLEIQGKKEEAEQFHSRLLRKAEETHCLPIQVLCLEKMANAFLERKNYITAIKLYNSALALYLQQLPEITLQKAAMQLIENKDIHHFYTKMAEAICGYLKTLKINVRNPQNIVKQIMEQRQLLFTMRNRLKTDTANPDKLTSTLLKDIADTTLTLVTGLVEHISKTFLAKPPCPYAIVGFGSLARGEKCTHSDWEYGILIKIDSEKNRHYFRQLAQIIEFYIVANGETNFPICDKGRDSPTLPGFCIDPYGISPVGRVDSLTGKKASDFELIGTPEQLADYQQPRWFIEEPIVSTAIRHASFIMGEKTLLEDYYLAVQHLMAQTLVDNVQTSNTSFLLREERALALLEEALDQFQPRLDQQKEHDQFFVIKRELYRLLSSVINYLALFYGFKASGFEQQLQALYEAKKLNAQGKATLERVMDIVLRLRIRAQLHYGQEYEAVWHPAMSADKEMPVDPLRLTNAELADILQVYQTLLPLYQAAKSFCEQKGQTDIFLQQNFYDERPIVQGDAYQRLGQYHAASEHYQKAIALDAFDAEALNRMGLIHQNLAEFERAATYYERALATLEKKLGHDHSQVAEVINNLGIIKNHLNKHAEAIKLFERALSINQNVFSESSAAVAVNLNNMGLSFSNLTHKEKARECYEKALVINQSIYGKTHATIAVNLSNLGTIWNQLGNKAKATEYYKQALSMAELVYGANHPKLTPILHNLGKVLQSLGKIHEAIAHFERAFFIKKTCYGLMHRKMALTLSDLGLAWLAGKNPETAIPLLKQAVLISEKTHGKAYPTTVTYQKDLDNATNVVPDPYETESEFSFIPILAKNYSLEKNIESQEMLLPSTPIENKLNQSKSQTIATNSDNDFTISELQYGHLAVPGEANVPLPLSPEEVAKRKRDIRTGKINKEFMYAKPSILNNYQKTIDLRTFGLNHLRLEDEDMPIIIEKLARDSDIKYIDLSGNNIADAGIKLLANFIKPQANMLGATSVELKGIFLSGNKLTDVGIQALAEITSSSLEAIDLSENKISNKGAYILARFLEQNVKIDYLNLSGNEINEAGFNVLIYVLRKRHMDSFTLCGLTFKPQALRDHSIKESISLKNGISTEQAYILSILLKNNVNIETLALPRFSMEGVKILAAALEKNATVKHLSYTSNLLETNTLRVLISALQVNTIIESLFLHKVGDENALVLATCLEQNTALRSLGLWECKIGVKGILALIAALEKNTTLEQINLIVGNEGARALAAILKKNKTLKFIKLYDTEIEDEGAQQLLEALQENTVIEKIDLSYGTKIKKQIFDQIQISLLRNQQLRDQLHQFVRTGNLVGVKESLSKGASVFSTTGEEENTPLHWAMQCGYPAIAQLLMETMAAENKWRFIKNKAGLNALQLAQRIQQQEMVDLLNKRMSSATSIDILRALNLPSSSAPQNYFHENLDREGAEKLLTNQKAGVFLIRSSSIANSVNISYKSVIGTIVHLLWTSSFQKDSLIVDHFLKTPLAVDATSDLPLTQAINTHISNATFTPLSNSIELKQSPQLVPNNHGNEDILSLINKDIVQALNLLSSSAMQNYFHEDLDREGAEKLLINQKTGVFLVRSSSVANSISVSYKKSVTGTIVHLLLTLLFQKSSLMIDQDGELYYNFAKFIKSCSDVLKTPLAVGATSDLPLTQPINTNTLNATSTSLSNAIESKQSFQSTSDKGDNKDALFSLINKDILQALNLPSSSASQNYFHENLDREGAEKLLTTQKTGAFLIRSSSIANSVNISYKSVIGTIVHLLWTSSFQKDSLIVDHFLKTPLAVGVTSDLPLTQPINANTSNAPSTSLSGRPRSDGFWKAPPKVDTSDKLSILKNLEAKYPHLAVALKSILPKLIENDLHYKNIDLRKCQMNDTDIAALAEVLLTNTWVETIDIRNNPGLSYRAIQSLIVLLNKNKNIHSINLDENKQLNEKDKELLQLNLEYRNERTSKNFSC